MVRGKVYHGLRFPCKGLRAAGSGDPAFNGLEIDVFRFRARNWIDKTICLREGELAPVVRGNGYFDAIVPASRLLGLD